MWRVLQTVTVVVVASLGLSAQSEVAQPPAGALPWMNTSLTPEQRADLLIPQMTLEQKVQQLSNDVRPARDAANRPPGCEFTRSGVTSRAFPSSASRRVRMTNGGTGFAGVTACPSRSRPRCRRPRRSAATFNPDLAGSWATSWAMKHGSEGHQVMLGPADEPGASSLRRPQFRLSSEDPYLSGVMALETIKGIQAKASTRCRSTSSATNRKRSGDRWRIRDPAARAARALSAAVRDVGQGCAAGVRSCAPITGTQWVSACSNAELLTTTLREQWGFGDTSSPTDEPCTTSHRRSRPAWTGSLRHETPLLLFARPAARPARQPGQRRHPRRPRSRQHHDRRHRPDASAPLCPDVQVRALRHRTSTCCSRRLPTSSPTGSWLARSPSKAIVLLKNENNFLPLKSDERAIGRAHRRRRGSPGWRRCRRARSAPTTRTSIAPYTVTPKQGTRERAAIARLRGHGDVRQRRRHRDASRHRQALSSWRRSRTSSS